MEGPAEPVLAGKADLGTIETGLSSGGDASYNKVFTSADGWTTANAAIQVGGASNLNPAYTIVGPDKTYKAVCLNGKVSAAGTLTSPELTGGMSILKFKWAKMFTDTAIDFTVKVTDLTTGTEYTKTYSWAGDKNDNKLTLNECEFVLPTAIEGNFKIEFVNNSPSQNTGNKDRVTILDIEWYK